LSNFAKQWVKCWVFGEQGEEVQAWEQEMAGLRVEGREMLAKTELVV
jgi:hypothetical protein